MQDHSFLLFNFLFFKKRSEKISDRFYDFVGFQVVFPHDLQPDDFFEGMIVFSRERLLLLTSR